MTAVRELPQNVLRQRVRSRRVRQRLALEDGRCRAAPSSSASRSSAIWRAWTSGPLTGPLPQRESHAEVARRPLPVRVTVSTLTSVLSTAATMPRTCRRPSTSTAASTFRMSCCLIYPGSSSQSISSHLHPLLSGCSRRESIGPLVVRRAYQGAMQGFSQPRCRSSRCRPSCWYCFWISCLRNRCVIRASSICDISHYLRRTVTSD